MRDRWRCRMSRGGCDFKGQCSPCVPPPSSLFFSSSIAFILASWTSARAFHSLLLLFNPSNMGLISEWKRANSCKHAHTPTHTWVSACITTQRISKKWNQGGSCLEKIHVCICKQFVSRYLVHEGADKVDKTTLHFRQLISMISVHHWLKKKKRRWSFLHVSVTKYTMLKTY